MKFKFKAIAAAVVLAAASQGAHAALSLPSTGNGSLFIYALSTSTNSYYMRDLGSLLNSFLPTGVTTASGDGSATGDKTPAAGLTITNATSGFGNFADASFSTWAAGKSDIQWTVAAGDSTHAAGSTNLSRSLIAANSPGSLSNQGLDNATGTYNGLLTFSGLSTSGTGINSTAALNWGLGAASLGTLGNSLNAYYYVRTTGNLSNATVVSPIQYANGAGPATFTLASNGDLTYNLAAEAPAAVPLPAAIWLLGSGLFGLVGVGRRRKAAV